MRLILLYSLFLSPALSQTPPLFGFEPNLGQFPPNVLFMRRSAGNSRTPIYLTRDAMVLSNGMRMQIAGVDPKAVPTGDSPSGTIYNYYQGSNASNWRANVHLFTGVRLANIYPGASALFTTSEQQIGPSVSVDQGIIVLTLQPGADLSPFRLRVLNNGSVPFEGPGGIWFSGGRIPGVFIVSLKITQTDSANQITVASNLKIESSDTLSIQAANLNPALPAQAVITFHDYDGPVNSGVPAAATDGNRYIASSASTPATFGEDGQLSGQNCQSVCTDALVARLDDAGKPIWVSIVGGGQDDESYFVAPSTNGVAVSGTTASQDFPVTANAPRPVPGSSSQDVFLSYFDRDSGQLRNATYTGITGAAWAQQQAVNPTGDVAVAGGYYTGAQFSSPSLGYLLLWRPIENRFLFSQKFDAPLTGLVFDANSHLYFASVSYSPPGSSFTTGVLDATGKQQGSLVKINAPVDAANFQFDYQEIRLLPAPDGDVWAVYRLLGQAYQSHPLQAIAKASPARGQVVFNRLIAGDGVVGQVALTPAGNLKLLVQSPAATEATTTDAPLVAACPDTSYFAIVSPSGQTAYATYVPNQNFDFTRNNEPQSPAQSSLGCFENAAGRLPIVSAAPGQLITITGGGFGPSTPIYTVTDANRKYPLTAGGFRVRISGVDASIIAVARGLIAAQVPYEVAPSADPASIEVSADGTPLNSIPFSLGPAQTGLFDTGDRNNSLNLPALAALNEDGTVNGINNPAPSGSVLSIFGTGLGTLSPPLVTGDLSPVPPAAPLSQTTLLSACYQCEILYLGSAPGLSTSVFQANVRVHANPPATGTAAVGIGIAVSQSPRSLFIFSPTGVVFVK